MERSWYGIARECVSLRKHVLRVDPCVFIDEETTFSNKNVLDSTIKSILTAAIIKGLDVIGVLTKNSPTVGWMAWEMAKKQQMDIAVLPGQTYICTSKEELYIYKLKQPLKPGFDLPRACEAAHKLGGFVIATNLTKQKVLDMDKLQGSLFAPDAVEIYNEKAGAFQDLDVDFPKFVSSASTSGNDLESSNAFTLLPRREAEKMGLLAPNEGVDFEPKYLKPKSQGVPNA
jgi:hypothetical protein